MAMNPPRSDAAPELKAVKFASSKASVERLLEPLAAIRQPPAENEDRNRGDHRPDKRQNHISAQADHKKRRPKYFSLHKTSNSVWHLT